MFPQWKPPAVPEVAVDENGQFSPSINKIGAARQISSVPFHLDSLLQESSCHRDLRAGVLAANPRHYLTAHLRQTISPVCFPGTGLLPADQRRWPALRILSVRAFGIANQFTIDRMKLQKTSNEPPLRFCGGRLKCRDEQALALCCSWDFGQ